MLPQATIPDPLYRFAAGRNRTPEELSARKNDRKRISFTEIFWWATILLLGIGTYSKAQTAAEYSGAVSGMGSAGTTVRPAETAVFAPTEKKEKKQTSASHLTQSNSASGEDANRKELEGKAGEDAGKLLLRSTPKNAVVWIEGKRIGSTPILLMLPPGAYQVGLRGPRMETAERRLDVQPRETRTVIIPLRQRYPSQVKLP